MAISDSISREEARRRAIQHGKDVDNRLAAEWAAEIAEIMQCDTCDELRAELARLRKIKATLPKTRDGQSLIDGMTVYIDGNPRLPALVICDWQIEQRDAGGHPMMRRHIEPERLFATVPESGHRQDDDNSDVP